MINSVNITVHRGQYFQYLHLRIEYYCILLRDNRGRDNSVGIVTRYGLDSPGIEARDFPHASRPALEPTQPPIQWVPGLSRE